MPLHAVMITRIEDGDREEYQLLWTEKNGTTSMVGGFATLNLMMAYMLGRSVFGISSPINFENGKRKISAGLLTESHGTHGEGWSVSWTEKDGRTGQHAGIPSLMEALNKLAYWLK